MDTPHTLETPPEAPAPGAYDARGAADANLGDTYDPNDKRTKPPEAPPPLPPVIALSAHEGLQLHTFRLQRALLSAQRDLLAHEAATYRAQICLSHGVPYEVIDAYVYDETQRALVLRVAPGEVRRG